ncbi:hypothetical protein [Deinococcus yavapaiensis]|uniref:Uncharacterized protein n=1 Tax=Deinococcus yavapaiensis KR-236 TaxID=694435 RepID=A0A318S2T3_9DEIO|nr:hypothetical protein [Deinococcus yavapaiensis]PYE50397.1 hypothetical protein DES52_11814 [Deinococcus yavapaiensis KR-236]
MRQDTVGRLLFFVTATLLLTLGVPLLFAADTVTIWLFRVSSPAGEALAQVAAAGLLGLGVANWWSREQFIGGIYGRPLGLANLLCFMVLGTSLGRATLAGSLPGATWLLVLTSTLLTLTLAWRMFLWRPSRHTELVRGG